LELRKRIPLGEPIAGSTAENVSLPTVEQPSEVIPGIPPRHIKHRHSRSPLVIPKMSTIVLSCLITTALVGGGWWYFDRGEIVTVPIVEQPKPTAESPSIASKQQVFQGLEVNDGALGNNQAQPIKKPNVTQYNPEAIPPAASSAQSLANTAAVSTTAPSESHSIEERIHVVKQGETLYRISVNYYQTGQYSHFLAQYNQLQHPTDLVSGKSIKIPFPPGTP
jgi:LysM repeat protein